MSATGLPAPAAAGPRTGATSTAAARATPAITAKTVPAPPAPSRTPASAGAPRMLETLDPAGCDVCRRQLFRRAGKRRHQHGLNRARDRHRGGGDGGERVCRYRRAAAEEHCRRRAHRAALRCVANRQDSRRREAAAERCSHRSEDRRGHELNKCDKTRGRCAATLVRVDEHRDPHAPLRRVEPDERELDPPQIRIAHHAAEHPRDLRRVAHRARRRRS